MTQPPHQPDQNKPKPPQGGTEPESARTVPGGEEGAHQRPHDAAEYRDGERQRQTQGQSSGGETNQPPRGQEGPERKQG